MSREPYFNEYDKCINRDWEGYVAPTMEDDTDVLIEVFCCPVCDHEMRNEELGYQGE